MKLECWLDSKLPKTRREPIDPKTGEVDYALFERLCDMATECRYESDEARRREMQKEYEALQEGVEFRDSPHFIKHSFILGELAGRHGGFHNGAEVETPEVIGCHPETWDSLPEEFKIQYQVHQWEWDGSKFVDIREP